jgi:hypothetical protein
MARTADGSGPSATLTASMALPGSRRCSAAPRDPQAFGFLPLAGTWGNVFITPLDVGLVARLTRAGAIDNTAPLEMAARVRRVLSDYADEVLG